MWLDCTKKEMVIFSWPRSKAFTEVFTVFAENKRLTLFQGPPTYLRPVNSIKALSSGITKMLGQTNARSIAMDGNGFPYLHFTGLFLVPCGRD